MESGEQDRLRGAAKRMRFFKPGLLLASLFCFWAAAFPTAAQTAGDAVARGVRLQRQGDLRGAMAAYEQALKLAPGRLDALSNLSVVYLHLGRPEDALPGLQRAREAAPQHLGVAYSLGLAYFQTGRHEAAEQELARVVARQPANAKALHLHALCLLKLNEIERGAAALEKVLEAEPGNRQAAYTLGSVYIKAGRLQEADDLAAKRLKNDESPEALLIRGSAYLAKRKYREALKLLDKAREAAPHIPLLHSQIGVAMLYEGDRDRARNAFLAELAINADDFNANAFLGWLYQQEGDSERALQLLQTAYNLDRSGAGVRYLLAQTHHSLGNWKESEPLLEKVVERYPDFIPAHVMLARVYAKLRRVEEFREERKIIAKLNAEQQEKDLRGVDGFYDGAVLSMPGR